MQTSRFEVRLTPEQKEELTAAAAAEQLTMSGYVLALVRSVVNRQPFLSREEIDALHLSREQLCRAGINLNTLLCELQAFNRGSSRRWPTEAHFAEVKVELEAALDPFATMYSEAPRLATWAMNHHPEAFGQPTGRQVAPFSGRGMKTALQAMPAPDQAPTAESGHAIWQVDALRRRQGMTQSELKLEATVRCVTQAPKRASGMRCALSDAEWRLIEPILPCRPRCEPRTTSLRADVNWSRGTLSAVVARAPRTPTVVLRIDPSPPKKAPGCQAFPQSILK